MPISISPELIADELFYGSLTAGSAIVNRITVNNASWIDMHGDVVTLRHPLLYHQPLNLDWNELQMGEAIQQQILEDIEQNAVSSPPLNPSGDSAIRKLL